MIPIVVVALLASPMFLTQRSFGADWTVHLWLLRQQQLNIRALGHPGLFVSVRSNGVFYPIFAFAGSGLYTVGGYLAILLGDRPVLAYKLLYVGGFCMAYGGMTWLARQLGLRNWRSQVPGLVVVTGAYFITDFVGRGDLGEFMGVASIPLLLAAGRSLFTSSRVRRKDLLAFITAAFVFTGSHTITLLWGTIFIGFLVVVCLIAFGRANLRPVPWSRLAVVAGSGAIATGLNAWFLVPDLRYGLDTNIALKNRNKVPKPVLNRPGLLLNPLRTADPAILSAGRDIRVALPWMFALWALVVGVVLWRGRAGSSKRVLLGMFAVSAVYIVLITQSGVWRRLPHVLYNVQFPWRLNAYVLVATAVLVLLALRWQDGAVERVRRSTSIVLVGLMVFNVGAATWQVWRAHSFYVHYPRERSAGPGFVGEVVAARYNTPPSWYSFGDFRDTSTRVIRTASSRMLAIAPQAVVHSKFAGVLSVPDGPMPFYTNISAGSRFVKMTGIEAVGRTVTGWIVAVRRPGEPDTGPIAVTIEAAETPSLRFGELVSVVSLVLLLGLVLSALWPIVVRRARQ